MVSPFNARHFNYLQGIARPGADLAVQLVNLALPLRCLPGSQAVRPKLGSHANKAVAEAT